MQFIPLEKRFSTGQLPNALGTLISGTQKALGEVIVMSWPELIYAARKKNKLCETERRFHYFP